MTDQQYPFYEKEMKQLTPSLPTVHEEEKQDIVQNISEDDATVEVIPVKKSKKKTKSKIQSIHVSSLESSVDEDQHKNQQNDSDVMTQFNERDTS